MKLKQAEIGYLAGLLDGEGTICFKANGLGSHFRSPKIEISNTDEKMVQWVQRTFGGHLYKLQGDDYRKASYRWQSLRKDEISKILTRVLPYLITKRKQAEVMLRFTQMKTSRSEGAKRDKRGRFVQFYSPVWRERLYSEMRRLNKISGKHWREKHANS